LSQPEPNPDDIAQLLPSKRRQTLEAMRDYWENTRVLEPGELQNRHAELARTAALVSIAESLDRICDASVDPTTRRRMTIVADSLNTLSKELTKIRYSVR
jgi:hypothetical protein